MQTRSFSVLALILTTGVLSSAQVPPATSPLDAMTPGINTPGSPIEAYALSSLDTINHSNGHLNIVIPLTPVMGRGDAKAAFRVNVESSWTARTIQFQYNCTPCSTGVVYTPIPEPWHASPTLGQGVMLQRSSGDVCVPVPGTAGEWQDMLTTLTFVGPDGTEHAFRDAASGGQPSGTNGGAAPFNANGQFSRGFVFYAYDGSDAVFRSTAAVTDTRAGCDSGSGLGVNGTLQLKNGTQYTIANGYVTQIEDRNGNFLTFSNPGGVPAVSMTDGLGRVTVAGSPTVQDGVVTQQITYPDSTGSANHGVTLTWQPLSQFGVTVQSTNTLFGTAVPWCTADATSCGQGPTAPDPTLLASVTYPDKQMLQLVYDEFGEVTQVTLPTGGAYQYKYNPTVVLSTGSLSVTTCAGANASCAAGYVIERQVAEKDFLTNASDPTSVSQKIFFCPIGFSAAARLVYTTGSGSFNCTNNQGSGILSAEDHVTNPVNQLGTSYTNVTYKGWQEGKEYQTIIYNPTSDGTGINTSAPIKTDVSTWSQRDCPTSGPWWGGSAAESGCWFGSPNNTSNSASVSPVTPEHDPRVTTKTTTLGALTYQDQITFDEWNNEKERDEYGFGASGTGNPSTTIQRTTTTTFQNSTPGSGSSYNSPTVYLPSLPQIETVTDGTTTATTTLFYDSYPGGLTAAPNIMNHDTTYSTSFTVRGNPTSVQKTVVDSVNGNTTLTTNYGYDVAGNIVTTIDPRGVRHDYAYTDAGLGSGNTYAFPTCIRSYLAVNPTASSPLCSTSSTPPGTFTASATYNYYIGKATETMDINGNSTSYGYLTQPGNSVVDPFDRLTLVTRPDHGSTTITYDDTPGSVSVTSAVAQTSPNSPITTILSYDGLGRKFASSLSEGSASYISTSTAYDGKDRVCFTSLPTRGSVPSPPSCASTGGTLAVYDGADRVLQTTQVDGANSFFSYQDNRTLSTDPAGVSKLTDADRFGRLLDVWENWTSLTAPTSPIPSTTYPSSYQTTYTYDALDDLLTASQSGLTTRTFTYDSLKRLVKAANPESGTFSYSYDYSNNLATRTDEVRMLTYGAYDGLNRVTSKSYNDQSTAATPSVFYTYDGGTSPPTSCNVLGRLTSVAAGNLTNNYSCFDSMGRVTSSSEVVGSAAPYTFSYTYDLSGALSTETYPSFRKITNTFDAAGRITGVSGVLSGTTTPYAAVSLYAPQGAIQMMSYNGGSGVSESWGFNSRQQPNSLSVTQNATPQLSLGWTYTTGGSANNNGDILSQTIAGAGNTGTNTQTYTYDGVNRTVTFQETGGGQANQTYCYDAFGNRLVLGSGWIPYTGQTPQTASCSSPNFSVFTNNQWAPGSGLTYDAAGNQTQIVSPPRTFTYDGENRQITATTATAAASYTYDGEGRRVQKTVNGATTTYVYDAMGHLAAEYGSATASANGRVFLSVDALGSTRIVTDGSGNPLERYDYAPFGEELTQGMDGRGTLFPVNPLVLDEVTQKFTSKERDSETGLDYFGARYMSSAQGRFTSADPALFPHDITDPQSWNKYSYTRNNPLRYVDPDGEDWQDALKGFVNAFTTDHSAGFGRMSSGNGDFKTGQVIGDAAAALVGAVETAVGSSGEAVGVLLDATGAGAVLGVPLNVAAAGLIVDGGSAAITGGSNLVKAAVGNDGPTSSSGTSGGERAGKDFTKKGRTEVIEQNKQANDGQTVCQGCGQDTTPSQQSKKGVPTPGNETRVDHIHPKSAGGDGSPSNGQVLCSTCNLKKSDKLPGSND